MKKQFKVRKKMSDKGKSTLFLLVALVLTVAVGVLSITGMNLDSRGLYKLRSWVPSVDATQWPASLPLGLGLGGGVYTRYQAALPEGSEADLAAALDETVGLLGTRLKDRGYLDSAVVKTEDNQIRVEVADEEDVASQLTVLTTAGKLTFAFGDNVFLEGHIKSAAAEVYPNSTQPVVRVVLDAEGTKALADASTANAGGTLTISLDGQALISGVLDTAITTGELYISSVTSIESARSVASVLNAGVLPLNLTAKESGTVAPTLGEGTLGAFVIAGLVLVVAAAAVLLVRYLMAGVAAAWALAVQVILSFFLLAVFSMPQLMVPGLIGILVGNGVFIALMALHLEKFSAEIRQGRSPRGSVKLGWKEAAKKSWIALAAAVVVFFLISILPLGMLRSFGATALAGTVSAILSVALFARPVLYHLSRVAGQKPERFAKQAKA